MSIPEIYLLIGFGGAVYILLMHLKSCFTYFRQIYTSKYVSPNKIRTFFGIQFYEWSNNDSWVQVISLSSLMTLAFALSSLVFWPALLLFFLNYSIERARERITRDS